MDGLIVVVGASSLDLHKPKLLGSGHHDVELTASPSPVACQNPTARSLQ
jgi:hypothetical protein